MFFSGGSGGWTEEEYQAYVKKLQEEREARIRRMYQAQQLVDSIEDPQEKLAAQRQRYKCGEEFLTIDEIPAWTEISADLLKKKKQEESDGAANGQQDKKNAQNGDGDRFSERGSFMSFFSRRPTLSFDPTDKMARYDVDDILNKKIALIRGDITTLEVDGIVNAANSSLMGGGGVDGAIHSAAGPLLENECRQLNGAETGETKITRGYALPAKHILHTVGPVERGDRQLRACYRSSLDLCIKNNLKTVAFCCISTGIYGFPLKRATHIALDEARKFLNSLQNGTYVCGPLADNTDRYEKRKMNKESDEKQEEDSAATTSSSSSVTTATNVSAQQQQQPQAQPGIDAIEKIVFCVFTAEELQCYENLLPTYFPIQGFYAERYDPSSINPADLDDFNRDDARVWKDDDWKKSSDNNKNDGKFSVRFGGGGNGGGSSSGI